MNNRDVTNIVKAGVKFMALTGTAYYMRNLMPYTGIFGTACCVTTTFFVGMAMNDVVDKQMLKAERILNSMANGDPMVVF